MKEPRVLGGMPTGDHPAVAEGTLAGRLLRRLYQLVPESARARVRALRSLPTPRERRRYAVLLLKHELLGRRWRYQAPEFPVASVLFVCYGNIMRSAFACVAFRREAEALGWEPAVSSAGTNARNGKPADPRARAAAATHGLSLDDHRARLLDGAMVNDHDLIVAMDYLNATRILERFPHAAGRLVLLGTLPSERGRPSEIADPYDRAEGEVTACFEAIAQRSRLLARALDKARRR